jgi:hypothetical protein
VNFVGVVVLNELAAIGRLDLLEDYAALDLVFDELNLRLRSGARPGR